MPNYSIIHIVTYVQAGTNYALAPPRTRTFHAQHLPPYTLSALSRYYKLITAQVKGTILLHPQFKVNPTRALLLQTSGSLTSCL